MATSNPGTAGIPTTPVPTDPYLTDQERERLTPQCSRILSALRERPRWNYELAEIGLSYTRRISDLRAAGHQVDIIATTETGARLYGLVTDCPACKGWSYGCPDCDSIGHRLVAQAPQAGCNMVPINWQDAPFAAAADGVLAGGRVD